VRWPTQNPIYHLFLGRIVVAAANRSFAWCGSAPTLHSFVGMLLQPIGISRLSGLSRSNGGATMPLKKGSSRSIVSSNIKTLVDDWKKDGSIGTSHPSTKKKAIKQAVAIAMSKAGK
jgi:hypothetical protein